ncbi:MAG: hypothetical protein JSS39_15880 [Nitrospira sp.]|nr:hypothetical protein [Nitrospira sp.]
MQTEALAETNPVQRENARLGTAGRRTHKVSFNQLYAVSSNAAAAYGNRIGDSLTNNAVPPTDASSPSGWEYNVVRWLERESYDITYSTSVDSPTNARILDRHKGWLSVGHDEYWTWQRLVPFNGVEGLTISTCRICGNRVSMREFNRS